MLVVDAHVVPKSLGVSFRKGRGGPERELVNWFLERELVRVPRGHSATVFREPRLPSGFPDLVIVLWRESTTRLWAKERAHLTSSDLRLVHFLAHEGPQRLDNLRSLFSGSVEVGLERLGEASMVHNSRGCWQARPLKTIFAASDIIAVEAKVGEWRAALGQAHLNTWFASESYVLVPRVPRASELLRDAGQLGIKVISQEGMGQRIESSIRSRPRSYVSWLLNDWAWRAALSLGGQV